MSRLKYNPDTQVITIPVVKGVEYVIGGEPATGEVAIDEDTVVTAHPVEPFRFPDGAQARWTFKVRVIDPPADDKSGD